ncbi:DUF1501 domain-containing protein [Membranihabitans maritimus]|uniref:DUF1501 domain-containing protein n=1 Tax=Membranihabitans maritimus TaxID=2904244 RepID=UPI001F45D7F4|nr:DUF1501 domain-containing protein [Membranihabitans maritimus]
MESKLHSHSRRKFLSNIGCAALGYSTLYSSLINLKALNAAAIADSQTQQSNDYKALVCILLAGGNDSYNMLIPYQNDIYSEYAKTRSNLAIPKSEILPLTSPISSIANYGIHPGMSELQTLYREQDLAFVANVGTLVEPTSKEQFYSNSHRLPLGLFSHADQIQQWQTGLPHERSSIGWGARITEIIQSMNQNQNISMNISLSGTNVFQQGNGIFEFSIGREGAAGIHGFNDTWQLEQIRTAALTNLMEHQYQDIFKKSYINTISNAHSASQEFQSALENAHEFNTQFGQSDLSQSLKMIARVISVQANLGFNRQIFFLNFGGWDHHDEILEAQDSMLPILSRALFDFREAMKEINQNQSVTTFSISDFGRTLTSNGNGTDHAWGGNTIVSGGAVKGGKIYGLYPTLALKSSLDLGNGVLVPTTSADEYFTELALWYGVSKSDAMTIFPNLKNFYNPQSGNSPLGFLNETL